MTNDLNWGVALCCVTGELIQDGFYLQCADKYFKHEHDLIAYLKSIDDDDDEDRILSR
jgi:hypothetical protein